MSLDYSAILKRYWGYDSFRSIQLDIINSIGAGRDTLGLMPTGGGKSITFQVPALSKEGVCIVITPLLALMKDQVMGLRKRGILAHAVNSSMRSDEIMAAYDNCVIGSCRFLYVSPERLQSELFMNKIVEMNVAMIVVDEAHCISQWGYDFRPSYLHIAEIRKILPGTPVLALTATATPRVAADIMDKLNFSTPNLFKMSFERKNIAYVVRKTQSKEQQMITILQNVPGSGIVYVRSRKRTREYAEMLKKAGISADFFHAGLTVKEKDKRQEEWTKGKTRVIVCTNAFGMGIDKPDVRVVIHVDAPESLEAYFQEAGRAGRDGNKSYAVFLWSGADEASLKRNLTNSFPPLDFVVGVYNSICNSREIGLGCGAERVEEFDVEKFCYDTHRNISQVLGALAILERAGYMSYEPYVEFRSRLMFLVERRRLYQVEETYPHLSEVIKAVLRLYTGLFMEYATISEEKIAQMLKITRQEVYEQLLELSRIGVVQYNPQKKASLITWMCDREHEKYMTFPDEVYSARQKDAERRLDSVISYCKTDDRCRSRMLLEYFGDDSASDCGQCDVCLANKRTLKQAHADAKKIKTAVIDRLRNSGPLPYDVLRCLDGYDAREVAVVIRDMLDDHDLSVDLKNVYSLNI